MCTGSMGLSGCSRCLSVGGTAATPTIRRETVVQCTQLSVRRCWLQHPACFSSGGTGAVTVSHQPSKYVLHGRQALEYDSGSVRDPIDTADDAGQHVAPPAQPAASVDWRKLLWKALHSDSSPGQFACSGRLKQNSLYPDITIAGVGRLTLPLSRDQGLALQAVAEQAPHGRGLETAVDTAVRDAYQVDASKVAIASSWQPTLQSIVSEVAEAFGKNHTLDSNLDARLYKLLLYNEGSHFVAHQDTEKEPRMLATLVVQLPCYEGHTGGKLTVWHKGNTASATSLQYAAFSADCKHELRPVTRGTRLALVYNLVWVAAPADVPQLGGSSPTTAMSPQERQAGKLQQALKAWEDSIAAGSKQTRIAFMLDHQYTEWNLGFNHLKGSDRAKWRSVAALEGLETHLALVSRRIFGNDGCGDNIMGYQPQFDSESEGNQELDYEDETHRLMAQQGVAAELDPEKWEDVDKDLITAEKWVAQDGSDVDYGNIHQQEFYNADSTSRLFPLRYLEHHSGHCNYLGNEGASSIQIYKRAALVLWPSSQTLVNAERAGFRTLLPLLNHSLSKSGSHESDARVFVASVMEACVQLLEATLPIGYQVCGEEPQYCAQRDSDSSSFFSNHLNEDRTGLAVHDCTLMVLRRGLQAAQCGISTAAEMLQRIATAVEKRPDNYSLLKKLLQCSEVQAALSLPAVQQLVSCQIANLEPMSWIPQFSWHMPEADLWQLSLEDNVGVNGFLHGPEGTLTLCGYDSLRLAKRAVVELQADYAMYYGEPPSMEHSTYSFTAEAKADISTFCIVITKTKDWYLRQVEAKMLLKEELESVRAMRR